jgi:hypothetical protein
MLGRVTLVACVLITFILTGCGGGSTEATGTAPTAQPGKDKAEKLKGPAPPAPPPPVGKK